MQPINITPQAIDYISKYGDTITLEPVHASFCWGGANLPPSVRRGKPVIKPQDYISENVSGITVYHDRYLHVQKPLIIDIRKFLGISSLVLDGWVVL